jgi:PAS domain S-box-containing protein
MDQNERIDFLEDQIDFLNRERRSMISAVEMITELIEFPTSLNKIDDPGLILSNTASRVSPVIPFHTKAFYLVNEEDSDFNLTYVDPETEVSRLDEELKPLIEDGTFNWALGRNKPVTISSLNPEEYIMLHPLITSSRVRGMFFGIMKKGMADISDLSLILFSTLMLSCANSLESFELYHQIQRRNNELQEKIEQLMRTEKKLNEYRDHLEEMVKERTKHLEKSRIRYSLATEAAGIGVWDYTLESGELFLDPILLSLRGLAEDTVIKQGDELSSLVHPDDISKVKEKLIRNIKGESKSFNAEYRYRAPEGDIKWFLNQGSVIFRDEKPVKIVGTEMDITERKRTAEEKRNLENQLLQSQKMESLGTLAGGIAHDFNNILASIMGYTDISLELVEKDDVIGRNLDQVLKACRRAKELVEQILLFSRRNEYQFNTIKMNTLVSECLKFLKASIPAGIDISSEILPDDLMILGNATQIQQIIINLCTNASHAMKDEGGTIKVRLEVLHLAEAASIGKTMIKAGTYAVITVSDTGIGIDEKIIDRIFDPFFTTKGPSDGSGMGLSVVHGIVMKHSGAIEVISTPGAGSTFRVLLPTIGCTETEEIQSETETAAGEGTILFIDDEADILDIASQMLERIGYDVTTCSDPESAVELVRKKPNRFDCVVTDYFMPKMNGMGVAKKILEIRSEIPIILCTGYSEKIDRETALRAGIRDVIMKPFFTRELAEVIGKSLQDDISS